jgi:Na+-transporting NADH:ubiquinone oxidoreductase subunit NqrB
MNPQPLTASQPATTAASASPPSFGKRVFAALGNPYVPPIFITLILLVGNLSYGILESYWKTLLAIVTSVIAEMVLGRIFLRKWPHPASAYITGISVGILLRSPAFWPYALCSLLSITSKYALRFRGRHIWNPSNFGICAMLFLASQSVASLSIQWGNNLGSLVVIWALGSVILWRARRRRILYCPLVSALMDHRRSLAIGDFAHYRANVSTLHLLHDHRSQNHYSLSHRSVHRRLFCSGS